MAGTWVRSGTIALTSGSKKVTGTGTAWNSGLNKVTKGCALKHNNIDYEVDYINSDTELYLVDTYNGVTVSGQAYRIQVAVTDTIPELSSRIAQALAYWNGQGANLQLMMSGSGNVTLTFPDGTQVTIPAWGNMQPKDALLTALAKLTMSEGDLIYATGSDAFSTTSLTNFARSLLAAADASTARETLGVIGSSGSFSFRNKVPDGAFNFWNEATSQTSSGYGSDTMSLNSHSGSTKTHYRQLLVGGIDLPAVDVPTAKYFSRTVVSSVAGASNFVVKRFRIENVSTLAGKTATFSLYGRADASKKISVSALQNFGTGGSPSSPVNGIGAKLVQLTSLFSRNSIQITFPSISGKTLGTNNTSYIEITVVFDAGTTAISANGYASGMVQQSGTFDIACVQLEDGSVMTPFEELPLEVSQQRVDRNFETSYQYGTTIGTESTSINRHCLSSPGSASVPANVKFRSEKRAIPSISIFASSTGAVGYLWNDNTVAAVAVSAVSASTTNIGVVQTSTVVATNQLLGFHWVADARL